MGYKHVYCVFLLFLVCLPGFSDDLGVKDFLSGKPVSDEELISSNCGFKVSSVALNSPAEIAGLKEDDWILALDGIRFFGDVEYDLIRFSNPDKRDYDFVIKRKGKIFQMKVTDLLPKRRSGFGYYYRRGEFREILENLNIPYDKTLWRSLQLFECRPALLLKNWLASDPDNKHNIRWLLEFFVLFKNMTEQKYEKIKALSKPSPIPFFNRLSDFYVAVAQHYLAHPDIPDWKSSGESLDFYILYYPYPKHIDPPMGDIDLSDDEFEQLLPLVLNGTKQEIERAKQKAYSYMGYGDSDGDNFINDVKVSLLNPSEYAVRAYRGPAIWHKESRKNAVREVQAKFDKNDSDRVLYAYALFIPAIIQGEHERALDFLDYLNEHSPFFTAKAINMANYACKDWREPELKEKIYQRAVEYNIALSPKPDPVYRTYLKKNLPGKWYVLRYPPEGFKDNPFGLREMFGVNVGPADKAGKTVSEKPADLDEEKQKRRANLKALYDGCRMYYLNNDAEFPEKLSDLYPDYIMDLGTFCKYGRTVEKKSIDTDGAFVLMKGITADSPGNAVFLKERPDELSEELLYITADGTIKTGNNPEKDTEKIASLKAALHVNQNIRKPGSSDYYRADFNSDKPLPEWTHSERYILPEFNEKTLGRFAKGDVYLTLTDLPKHSCLKIEFKLYILTSMDGNQKQWGPDIWSAKIIDGPSLLYTSFSTWSAQQSYPMPFGYGDFEKHSAGMEITSPIPWGKKQGSTWDEQTRYFFRFYIPHTEDNLKIVFSGVTMGGINDEAWCLDDVTVDPLQSPPPAETGDTELQNAWDALAGDDVRSLYYGMRDLVAAGDRGADLIIRKLGWKEDGELRQNLESIAEVLKYNDRQQWEEALQMGTELGPRAEPFIRYHLDRRRFSADKPPWFNEVMKYKEFELVKDPDKLRQGRAAHILELIWTDKARRALFLDKVK